MLLPDTCWTDAALKWYVCRVYVAHVMLVYERADFGPMSFVSTIGTDVVFLRATQDVHPWLRTVAAVPLVPYEASRITPVYPFQRNGSQLTHVGLHMNLAWRMVLPCDYVRWLYCASAKYTIIRLTLS